jgi:hypothetical protein
MTPELCPPRVRPRGPVRVHVRHASRAPLGAGTLSFTDQLADRSERDASTGTFALSQRTPQLIGFYRDMVRLLHQVTRLSLEGLSYG